MKIIVDTCVWSLAFRRKQVIKNNYTYELQELIKEGRIQMLGPIRQELLSGLASETQFEKLRIHLSAFPDLALPAAVYEEAARCSNLNRKKGVQGSAIDFLICAVSIYYSIPILTLDQDFIAFKEHLPIFLYLPRS